MRTITSVAIVMLCVGAGLSNGQPGHIALSSSETDEYACEFAADPGAPLTVYVWHYAHAGAVGARYRVSTCNSNLVFIGQTVSWPFFVGTAETGISVAYGSCQPAPVLIQSILYMGGPPPLDSGLAVKGDPLAEFGQIEGYDCSDATTFPSGGVACFGCASVNCNPLLDGNYQCVLPLPVETSTWGQIKHLYE